MKEIFAQLGSGTFCYFLSAEAELVCSLNSPITSPLTPNTQHLFSHLITPTKFVESNPGGKSKPQKLCKQASVKANCVFQREAGRNLRLAGCDNRKYKYK